MEERKGSRTYLPSIASGNRDSQNVSKSFMNPTKSITDLNKQIDRVKKLRKKRMGLGSASSRKSGISMSSSQRSFRMKKKEVKHFVKEDKMASMPQLKYVKNVMQPIRTPPQPVMSTFGTGRKFVHRR